MQRTILIAAFFSIFILACDVSITKANRSGSIDNDYIEEPLSDSSKKFEEILNTSNELIELIRSENYQKIYSDYVLESMKPVLTPDLIEKSYSSAKTAMGEIKEYKKMQWGFRASGDKDKTYVVSYKILIHEKGRADYYFTFEDDGDQSKILGFGIKPRKKARSPNEV